MSEEIKILEEGIRVSQFCLKWPHLLLSPLKEKERKSPLAGISQRYILMNPSQNTQAQESHISKMRGVYMYVHVFIYTSHVWRRKRGMWSIGDWSCSRSFSSRKEKVKRWQKGMVLGTRVKWQFFSTCLYAHICFQGCPGFPIILPLLLVTTRRLTRKEGFARKFSVNTWQSQPIRKSSQL